MTPIQVSAIKPKSQLLLTNFGDGQSLAKTGLFCGVSVHRL
jgi:hypothetical protein